MAVGPAHLPMLHHTTFAHSAHARSCDRLACKIVAEGGRDEDINRQTCVEVYRAPICGDVIFEPTVAKYMLVICHGYDVHGAA